MTVYMLWGIYDIRVSIDLKNQGIFNFLEAKNQGIYRFPEKNQGIYRYPDCVRVTIDALGYL